MIKYTLHCEKDHVFEGWFRDSEDFEAQLDGGYLQCPICGSLSISKKLMTPSVTGTRSQNDPAKGAALSVETDAQVEQAEAVQKKAQDMARQLREHVIKNADYVGDKFAEEARKIHFEESEKRGIYGEATKEEAKSLVEDGIECLPLPVLPEDQN